MVKGFLYTEICTCMNSVKQNLKHCILTFEQKKKPFNTLHLTNLSKPKRSQLISTIREVRCKSNKGLKFVIGQIKSLGKSHLINQINMCVCVSLVWQCPTCSLDYTFSHVKTLQSNDILPSLEKKTHTHTHNLVQKTLTLPKNHFSPFKFEAGHFNLVTLPKNSFQAFKFEVSHFSQVTLLKNHFSASLKKSFSFQSCNFTRKSFQSFKAKRLK